MDVGNKDNGTNNLRIGDVQIQLVRKFYYLGNKLTDARNKGRFFSETQ